MRLGARVERGEPTAQYPRSWASYSKRSSRAAGAAISPVVFLVQLTTLTGPRSISRGTALFLGAASALIVVSTIGVLLGSTWFSTGTNMTSFALYIPALALIVGSGPPLGQRGLAGLIILLIALAVAWVPLLLAAAVLPRRAACCRPSATG